MPGEREVVILHVVIISDSCLPGGASLASLRLAESLARLGHRITWLGPTQDQEFRPWRTRLLRPARFLPRRAVRRLLPVPAREKWDRHATQIRLKRILRELRPDAINVNNLHAAGWAGWSEDLLSVCRAQAPTFWTLHDAWSFTGRCVYSYDCRAFLKGCDASCPTPNEYPALPPDRIAGAWSNRQRLLASLPDLVAIAPSNWLATEAKRGLWRNHRVEVIPYGVPLDTYSPMDRHEARQALGLEAKGPVLFISAFDLSDRRAGGDYLVSALSCLSEQMTVITMGSNQVDINIKGIATYHLGFVKDERKKVQAFNAADILVHPAPVGNQPLVCLEAISCGTPIVAFPVNGLPEIVRPGRTGWLAEHVTSDSYARALDAALSDLRAGADLRRLCRALAEEQHSPDRQAQQYLGLFTQAFEPRVPVEMV